MITIKKNTKDLEVGDILLLDIMTVGDGYYLDDGEYVGKIYMELDDDTEKNLEKLYIDDTTTFHFPIFSIDEAVDYHSNNKILRLWAVQDEYDEYDVDTLPTLVIHKDWKNREWDIVIYDELNDILNNN